MLRTALLIIALLILVAIGLIYFNVLGLQQKDDGSVKVTTNSVEFTTEKRTIEVDVPVVKTVPSEPAPAPAPANGQ